MAASQFIPSTQEKSFQGRSPDGAKLKNHVHDPRDEETPHEGEGAPRPCRREPHDDTLNLVRHRCVLATKSCTLRQRAVAIAAADSVGTCSNALGAIPGESPGYAAQTRRHSGIHSHRAMGHERCLLRQDRQVLGVMNRFEFELEYVRERCGNDLMQLSLWQSDTLAGPLRGGTRTPREELLALVEQKSM